MVGERGFEPPTPWSRTRCSTRLSHSPTLNFHLQPRDPKRAASRSARLKKVSGLPAAPCGAASNARRPTRPPQHSQLLIDSIAVAHFSLAAPAGTATRPQGTHVSRLPSALRSPPTSPSVNEPRSRVSHKAPDRAESPHARHSAWHQAASPCLSAHPTLALRAPSPSASPHVGSPLRLR